MIKHYHSTLNINNSFAWGPQAFVAARRPVILIIHIFTYEAMKGISLVNLVGTYGIRLSTD